MSGFTVYKGKDSNDDTILLYLPDYGSVAEYPYETRVYSNLTQLLAGIPEYVHVATHFTSHASVARALETFGFPNVYSIEELDGETWTFPGGVEIKFELASNYGYIRYYKNDVLQISRSINRSTTDATVTTLYSNLLYNGRLGEGYYEEGGTWRVSFNQLYVYRFPNSSNAPATIDIWADTPPYVEPTDPYEPAGDSGPGGGEGTFDYTGNPPDGWDPTSPPSISAADTGFVTLYNPTGAELKSLSNYLWSSSFDLNTFKRIFNDPMELFIGFSIVPVAVPDGGRKEVGIGLISTGVYMTVAASQYVPVDCGTIQVSNFTGSYLDYDPYTKVELFLPYIGVRTLKADEVMGHSLHIGYWVDILSGACTAWVEVDGVPMYQFMGQCATSIPMASGDWTSLINGIIGAVGSVAAGAASGGVGGAIAGGVAAASAVAVNDGKIQVERSGAITSASGLLGMQKPVLYMSAPNLHKPANQNFFEGYPAYFTASLGDISGFTTIEEMRLTGIACTENELREIETLLRGGVIL